MHLFLAVTIGFSPGPKSDSLTVKAVGEHFNQNET